MRPSDGAGGATPRSSHPSTTATVDQLGSLADLHAPIDRRPGRLAWPTAARGVSPSAGRPTRRYVDLAGQAAHRADSQRDDGLRADQRRERGGNLGGRIRSERAPGTVADAEADRSGGHRLVGRGKGSGDLPEQRPTVLRFANARRLFHGFAVLYADRGAARRPAPMTWVTSGRGREVGR